MKRRRSKLKNSKASSLLTKSSVVDDDDDDDDDDDNNNNKSFASDNGINNMKFSSSLLTRSLLLTTIKENVTDTNDEDEENIGDDEDEENIGDDDSRNDDHAPISYDDLMKKKKSSVNLDKTAKQQISDKKNKQTKKDLNIQEKKLHESSIEKDQNVETYQVNSPSDEDKSIAIAPMERKKFLEKISSLKSIVNHHSKQMKVFVLSVDYGLIHSSSLSSL